MSTTPLPQALASGAIRSGTSLLYAGLGETLVERAGMVNLGLEGTMLTGACVGFIAAAETGSPYLGLAAAAVAGGAFNLLFGVLVITRRASQLASGLTLLFFAYGLTAVIGRDYVGVRINQLDTFGIPLLEKIPWFGPVLFTGDVMMFGMLPSAALVWWLLFRTRWGLALRTVGESREAAYAAGLSPQRIQYEAVFAGGLLGGLGGAHISLALAGNWVEMLTAGRGFIAVALVIFAAWQPFRVVAGALLFGGAIALQLEMQVRNAPISPFLLQMLPYLLTLLVLLWSGRKRVLQMPEGLKEVFEGTT
jgi:simple sugar transport system permease protein